MTREARRPAAYTSAGSVTDEFNAVRKLVLIR